MRASAAVFAGALPLAACAALADFDDFTAECPSGKQGCPIPASGGSGATGGAVGSGGASPSGGAGGTAGDGGTSGAASGGAAGPDSGVCAPPLRASGRGPAMARVVRGDGSAFWIDRTEVTVGQYAEFVRDGAPGRGGICEGSAGTEPSPCEADPDPEDPSLPRTCVDWCEAGAFCAWAGKELCRDDADRGAVAPAAELVGSSDFFAACSVLATATYGCGPGCGLDTCNGSDAAVGEPLAVGASTQCCVPDACGDACAISDLSGNVAEWTAACKRATVNSECVVRGGHYDSAEVDLRCATVTLEAPRRQKYRTVGFRCCLHR